jgi:hypothetical protein
MRHTSRLGASQRYVFLPVVVLIFSFMFGRTVCGQVPRASSAQSEQRVTSPALPAAWNEGVKALAEKIVAAVKPSTAISLEVKNISSLGSAEVAAVRRALETELASQQIRVDDGETKVVVTLSENDREAIWVAEIPGSQKRAAKVAMVPVTAPSLAKGTATATLSLFRELVWEQPERFLDFSVLYGVPGLTFSTLVVLEADDLNYYESQGAGWSRLGSLKFPSVQKSQRDPLGTISVAGGTVYAPGIRCTGKVEDRTKLECALWSSHMLDGARVHFRFEKHDESDEGALLQTRCGNQMPAVLSGDGDWTQPDTLQGYLMDDFRQEARPSGDALAFEGPVVVVHAEAKNTLRAIVRNLRSGNYEAYIVTATCSQ